MNNIDIVQVKQKKSISRTHAQLQIAYRMRKAEKTGMKYRSVLLTDIEYDSVGRFITMLRKE